MRSMFHPANVSNVDRPKLKNGAWICYRYHTVGSCFSDCRSSESHRKLDQAEAERFCKFLKVVREKRNAFMNGKHGQRNPQGPTADKSEPNGTGASPDAIPGA